MTDRFLPYGRHQVDEDDIDAVVSVLREGALTCGPKVDEFEKAFAEAVGAKEAVVCSNGTTALHLAAMALNLGPGDAVVVPTVTFLSTANAVRMTGADVVFADVCPDTGLLTPESLAEAFSKKDVNIKAVFPVHLNGQCAEMQTIKEMAVQHDAAIVTDCCHALGAEYAPERGGSPGDGQLEDLACFSLHPVKSIAMGEGGVVTTASHEVAGRLRLLRGQGMVRDPALWLDKEAGFSPNGEPNPWYYEMHELGYNYRATDMQCALGLSQLKKLPAFVGRRREIADIYQARLRSNNAVTPIPRTSTANSAWHLYPVLIDFEGSGKSREQVMRELADLGVGTQVHYIPVSSQPHYRDLYGDQVFVGAEEYYRLY